MSKLSRLSYRQRVLVVDYNNEHKVVWQDDVSLPNFFSRHRNRHLGPAMTISDKYGNVYAEYYEQGKFLYEARTYAKHNT
jgi:hypothetical protein